MTKDEILEKARRDYPIGTVIKRMKFSTLSPKTLDSVYDEEQTITKELIWECSAGISHPGIYWVYYDGKWAEIVSKPKKTFKGRYLKVVDDHNLTSLYGFKNGDYLEFKTIEDELEWWGKMPNEPKNKPYYFGYEAHKNYYFELMPEGFKPPEKNMEKIYAGRVIKALKDAPCGGSVRTGEYGYLVNELAAKFKSNSHYLLYEDWKERNLFEIMHKDFKIGPDFLPVKRDITNLPTSQLSEEERKDLLEYARKQYPVGCYFKPIIEDGRISGTKYQQTKEVYWYKDWLMGSMNIRNPKGEWAKIAGVSSDVPVLATKSTVIDTSGSIIESKKIKTRYIPQPGEIFTVDGLDGLLGKKMIVYYEKNYSPTDKTRCFGPHISNFNGVLEYDRSGGICFESDNRIARRPTEEERNWLLRCSRENKLVPVNDVFDELPIETEQIPIIKTKFYDTNQVPTTKAIAIELKQKQEVIYF